MPTELSSNITKTDRSLGCDSEFTYLKAVPCTVFLVMTIIVNLMGNTAVCYVVRREERLRRETRNTFVGSLALSDLAMTSVMVYRIVLFYSRQKTEVLKSCHHVATMSVTLAYITILHLLLLCLDRYIAVVYPLRYKTLIGNRFACLSLTTAWMAPIISMGVLPIFIDTQDQGLAFRGSLIGCFADWVESTAAHQMHMSFNVSLVVLGPYLFMLFAYGRIVKIAWFQSNRVEPVVLYDNHTEATSAVRVTVTKHNASQEQAQGKLREQVKRLKEMKWVKTVGLIVGAFTISYVPIYTASYVRVKRGHHSVPCWILEVGVPCALANSALNPLIFSLRSREYKRALWKLFGRKFLKQQVSGTNMCQRTNRLEATAGATITKPTFLQTNE